MCAFAANSIIDKFLGYSESLLSERNVFSVSGVDAPLDVYFETPGSLYGVWSLARTQPPSPKKKHIVYGRSLLTVI